MTPQSQPRRLLIGLLIIAWAVLDVVLVIALRWVSENHATGETLMAVITLGCYFAQLATLAGWLPLGDGRPLVRIPLCILTFFLLHGLFWLLSSRQMMNRNSEVFLWGSMYTGIVLLPLGGLRLLRYRCVVADQPGTRSGPLQFSILQIFLLTTCAAVVLAIVKHLPWNMPGKDLREFVLITLTLATVAWITWFGLFRLPVATGTFLSLIAAPLPGLMAGGIEGNEYWPWIGFTLITAAGLAVNLLVLRVCGYELVYLNRRSESSPSCPHPTT